MRRTLMLFCWTLAWLLAASTAFTQGPKPGAEQRELLYPDPDKLTGKFKEAVDDVRNLRLPPVPYEKLSPKTDYYVRIVPRKVVVDEKNQLKPNAVLGTKPFVFVTSPQGVTGKFLLDIYKDIGYEAADIITTQRDQDMVAVVFSFPRTVSVCDVRDGVLPADWARQVYVPTWDNVYALFTKLAESAVVEPKKTGEFQPKKLFFRSEAEKAFVVNYPRKGLERLRKTSFVTYETLMLAGGADWEYRKLLEDKLSVFAHFRGTGRTLNVVLDPYMTKTDTGIFEYIGPNSKLAELPEIAVVHLGCLRIEDTYSTGKLQKP
jgi:hypothetical protein